jgi:peptidoglycan/LPS O-acetylase OafA/YrhL
LTTAAPRNLPSLTALRGPAALCVFVFHVGLLWGAPKRGLVAPFLQLGPIGVSSFFVLSGFVLTWSHRDGGVPTAFWQNRFARVWPAHAAALLVALVLVVRLDQPRPWWAFAAQLLLVNTWLPIPRLIGTFNTVCWSLAVEALFYALFPWIVRALPRTTRALWVLLAACVAGVVGWELLAPRLLSGHAPLTVIWSIYWFPPARLPELVAGMALARLVAAGRVPRIPVAVAGVLWLGAAALVLRVPIGLLYGGLTLVPTLLLLSAAAQRDMAAGRNLLAWRPLVWAGEVSYAFYLVHNLVLGTLHEVLDPLSGVEVVPVAGFGFCVAAFAAWVLHDTVEVPARNRLRAVQTGKVG